MTPGRLAVGTTAATIIAAALIATQQEPFGRIFWHLAGSFDLPAACLVVVVVGLAMVASKRGGESSDWVSGLVADVDRYRHAIAILLWVSLCLCANYVYRNHPLSMDEYAARFQAEVFAEGHLHGWFPPDLIDRLIPKWFQQHFLMVNRANGNVVSAYWPGFSLLLAPFVALGIPWACNPTLVVMSWLLIGRLARVLLGSPQAAGWALLLALASPAFVANGIAFYSMPAHLLCNLLFASLLVAPSPMRLFLAGLVGGFALVLHNPMPHLAFAVPWVTWLVIRRGRRISDFAWLGVGYAPVVAVLGVGWSLWMRHLLDTGVPAPLPNGKTIANADEGIERVLAMAGSYARFLHLPTGDTLVVRMAGLAKLWLWASPPLLILAWLGAARAKNSVGLALLAASALTTFGAYFFIKFDQGHGWGYRYFHSAWFVLPILGAAGVRWLIETTPERHRMARMLMVMTIGWLALGNGQRLLQIGEFVDAHLSQVPPVPSTGRAIVFVRSGYYVKDLVQNAPGMTNRVLMFDSAGLLDDEAIARKLMPGGCKYASTIHSWVWAAADAADTPDRTACSRVPG